MNTVNVQNVLGRTPCRGHFQVGNSYCAVGAVMSEILQREDLGVTYHDIGMINVPDDVTQLTLDMKEYLGKDLNEYWSINDKYSNLQDGFKVAVTKLINDLEAANFIKVLDSSRETVST